MICFPPSPGILLIYRFLWVITKVLDFHIVRPYEINKLNMHVSPTGACHIPLKQKRLKIHSKWHTSGIWSRRPTSPGVLGWSGICSTKISRFFLNNMKSFELIMAPPSSIIPLLVQHDLCVDWLVHDLYTIDNNTC